MGVRRTLLRPIAWLGGKHAGVQVRAFLKAHESAAEVQARLLAELVAAHAGTRFGRDHSLASVRTCEDFRAAVPIGAYEARRSYMDDVFQGRFDALLPTGVRPMMFSMTSGTTGKPKCIPVTPKFLSAMRRTFNVMGLMALRDHPEAWLRHIVPISSSMSEGVSPTGLPCGAISGLLAATQKRIVRIMYPVPNAVSAIADPAARYYTILRCSIGYDVAIITTANPSSTIKLAETGQGHVARLIRDVADGAHTPPGELPAELQGLRFRRDPALARRLEAGLAADGRFLPGHAWNLALLLNWTGGTLKLYLPRLAELFGGRPVRDIGLLASEGRFSIPLADGTAGGVAEITGNFLEFVPADEHGRPDARTLLSHEVEVGQDYFLVVSNWSGLMRYDMDDRVRVTGRLGGSPVFEFLSRGSQTASMTGEKITEYQVVEAMRLASAATGAEVQRFVMQGRFASPPYYELRFEASAGVDAGRLAERMDAELAGLNIEYRSKRHGQRLGRIVPVLLPAGAMNAAETKQIQLRGGRVEQYKHRYLLTDVLADGQVEAAESPRP